MDKKFKTRSGNLANPKVLKKLIEVMINPANVGMLQKEIAAKVGVSVKTVQNYLTDEVRAEIERRRANEVGVEYSLAEIDKAVFAKAVRGDISAARILYGRWEEIEGEQEITVQSIEEIDGEIDELFKKIGELENGLCGRC